MQYTNKDVLKLIANNMFRHPNFWNMRNFKNRLHVVLLMIAPVSCNNETLRKRYNMAKYNFWSACGDSNDYDYFMACRRKLKECKSRTK